MITLDSVKILQIDKELKRILSSVLNMEPLVDTIREIKFVKNPQSPVFEIVLPNKRNFLLYQYKFMWILQMGGDKVFLSTTEDINKARTMIQRLALLPMKAEKELEKSGDVDITDTEIEKEKSTPEPPAEETPEPEA